MLFYTPKANIQKRRPWTLPITIALLSQKTKTKQTNKKKTSSTTPTTITTITTTITNKIAL